MTDATNAVPTIPAANIPATAPETPPAVSATPTPAKVQAELQQAAQDVSTLAAEPATVDPARPVLAQLVALLSSKYKGLGSDLNALIAQAGKVLAEPA